MQINQNYKRSVSYISRVVYNVERRILMIFRRVFIYFISRKWTFLDITWYKIA